MLQAQQRFNQRGHGANVSRDALADAYRALGVSSDASAIADTLKSLEFEVQLVTDVGKRDMDGVLERFARLAVTADTALFFYAGHAIQYQGKNYLMPVDAQLEDEISIRYNLVSVDDVRSTLDRASGVKIMILDACRNNPIADRLNRIANGGQTRGLPSTRGLARIGSACVESDRQNAACRRA